MAATRDSRGLEGAKPGFAPFSFLRPAVFAMPWALVAALSALSAGAARAQDYQPHMDAFNASMQTTQQMAGTAAMNAAIKRSLAQRRAAAASSARAAGTVATPRAPAAAVNTAGLSFRRDAATTERVRTALIAAMRRQNPGVAEAFARRSAGADYRQRFARTLPGQGLSNDNLADVAAYHVAVNWALVHRAPMPQGRSLQALRDQMRGSFSDNGVLARLAPAQRQWVADDFLFRSLNLAEKVDAFARAPQPATQSQFAQAAREDIRRSLGIDLQAYRFTEAGLAQ